MRFATADHDNVDVIIVGAGPAGTVTATRLAMAGLKVVIIERATFPRYHIGESLTATAAQILHEFGLADHMDRLDFPVKTGVKVIGHDAKSEFFVPAAQNAWQVRRAEFDKVLLEHAIDCGANHLYGSVKQVLMEGTRAVGVAYRTKKAGDDTLHEIRARYVVDATGHATLFSQLKVASPRKIEAFGRQIAVFTQVKHAERDPGEMGNNTVIFYGEQHQWAWFIPLSKDVTSVGVVMPVSQFKQCGENPAAVMAWGVDNINPALKHQLANAVATEPVRVIRNYSYSIATFVGDGWLCVGDSHQFTDPIFSFGVAFAMTEATAAAEAILAADQAGGCEEAFANYARFCQRGQDVAADMILYFWRFPAFFSFLTRGPARGDLIRLFSGDCFTEEELPALAAMRRSLTQVSLTRTNEARADKIASQVSERYKGSDEIDAAYIQIDDSGIQLTLLLAAEEIKGFDELCRFEEALYDQFGRKNLAIHSFTPDLAPARWHASTRQTFAALPSEEHTISVFDNRLAP